MRRFSIVLLLAMACAGGQRGKTRVSESVSVSDAWARERVQAFFRAVDTRNADELLALTTGNFTLFSGGRILSTKTLTGLWAKLSRPNRTRSCTGERILRSPATLVYIGDCSESQPANGDSEAQTYQGWNTVVLVLDAGRWKASLWQWQRSGIAGERARWNDVYRRGTAFSKKPTQLLVESIDGVKPGAALVLAMGQGRNALFLASKGWQVTGVDISEVGVAQARKQAAAKGLALDAVVADANTFEFGTQRYELVTMLYAGGDPAWIERAKAALKPGGRFVLEHFYEGDIGFAKGEPRSYFAGWDIVTDRVVEDVPDWGKVESKLVRFVARKRMNSK